MKSAILIYITAPDLGVARKLARVLLKERLVACVNILAPIESHYWWENRLEKSSERVLIAKSIRSRFPAIVQLVAKHHPYKVPCILAIPVIEVFLPFLRWIETEVKTPPAQKSLKAQKQRR